MTLFVGNFVFFLIQVFTYMDDIIGKGMPLPVLIEFFTYSFVSWLPAALPLAVLLSSIMCFGNLAENYELAAMKSSGLSLFRIIKPIFVFILLIAVFSFLFNNYILPKITLKASRVLWDIRQAKPTLSIKEGVYYSQLDGYSIKVNKKSPDGKTLYDLNVYDHTASLGNNVQLYADSGLMKTSADTNYLQIQMYDGTRYEDVMQEEKHKHTRPLMQLMYKELAVNVDMSGFKMKNTEEALFKGHAEMMNIFQINNEIDTFNVEIKKRYSNLHNQFSGYFITRTLHTIANDSIKHQKTSTFYKDLNKDDFRRSVENAQNLARNSLSFIDTIIEEVNLKEMEIADYKSGWHKKINMSFVCIVLFFVGASLGAIIRKGGMGLPVVVAVLFFLLYYIISIVFERLVYQQLFSAVFGMWFPLFVFLPIAVFLTYKAAKDSALFDFTLYAEQAKRFFGKNKSLN